MPDLLPGAAVLQLYRTAVAGQALRAVSGRIAEQPAVDPRWPGYVLGPGDGRVAICPGDERQGSGLVEGQSRGPGEPCDIEVEQEPAA